MKDIVRRNAGFLAAILGIVLILLIYIMLGTVDLVFMKDGFQVARMDDVRVFSNLELDPDEVITGEELSYIYGENSEPFKGDFKFRIEIAKVLVINFFTHKWEPTDYVIVLKAI